MILRILVVVMFIKAIGVVFSDQEPASATTGSYGGFPLELNTFE